MNIYKCLFIAISVSIISGCGTFLSVSQTTVGDTAPNGIAVNKRVNYSTEVTFSGFYEKKHTHTVSVDIDKKSVSGIDKNNVLVINGKRMPFSSGKLEITLTEEQLTSKVGITSQTGATRTVQAAGEIKKLTEKPEKPKK